MRQFSMGTLARLAQFGMAQDLVRKLQIYRLLWQYFLTGIRYRNVSIYDIEFGAIEPNYS